MDNEYLKRIYGLLESGATLGTGAVSGLVGLPYGLYKGVTSGAYGTPEAPRIAAREAQQFMERNTYQPRSVEGQANLQQLAGLLEASKLPPVMPELSLLAAIPKQAYAAQAERAGMAAEKEIAPVVTRTMERGGLLGQSKVASDLPVETSGLLQSPRSLTMPEVPTAQQMEKYGRIETVPLSKAVSFQSARNWENFGKNPRGDLIKGYGDKPVALRLETGEYVIYDGNHRTDLALKKGKSEIPMHVIDVKAYDPAHAGRRPAPQTMSDDELLRSLLD